MHGWPRAAARFSSGLDLLRAGLPLPQAGQSVYLCHREMFARVGVMLCDSVDILRGTTGEQASEHI